MPTSPEPGSLAYFEPYLATRRAGPKPQLTPEQQREVKFLHADGIKKMALATQFSVSRATIDWAIQSKQRPLLHDGPVLSATFLTHGYLIVTPKPDWPFMEMCFPRAHTPYVLAHRFMMANDLGRALLRTETVHHLNGDRLDNRVSNLQLRSGQHGRGQAWCCADCGSKRLVPVML